jgi:hypothetical protein
MSYGTEIGYLTEMGSLDYPFVNVAPPQELREFFSDMVVTVDRDRLPSDVLDYLALVEEEWLDLALSEWLSTEIVGELFHGVILDSLSMTAGSLSFVLKYKSADNSTTLLLDTAAGSTTTASYTWGSNPTWKVYSYADLTTGVRVKVVVNTAKQITYSASNLDLTISARCLEIRPARVDQITAYDTDTSTPYTFGVEDIKLAGGTNMVLDLDDSGVPEIEINAVTDTKVESQVVFNCIPGKGAGKFKPDCADEQFIRVINGVSADKFGAFNFDARECYWLEKLITFVGSPPATNPRKGTTALGTLKFNNDCTACVTCDDFFRAYQKLTQIHDRADLLHGRVMSALKFYDYYRNLASVLKEYINETDSTFTVVKENANLFTIKVTLTTGKRALDMFDASLLTPSGFNIVPKKGSGWRKFGSKQKPRPVPDNESPVSDNHISYPVTVPATPIFGANTVSYWQWSFYLVPVTITPETVVTQSVQFSMTMSAHEFGGSTINLGTFVRTSAITY